MKTNEKKTLISLVNESDKLTNDQKEVLIDKILNSKGKESFINLIFKEILKNASLEFIKLLL